MTKPVPPHLLSSFQAPSSEERDGTREGSSDGAVPAIVPLPLPLVAFLEASARSEGPPPDDFWQWLSGLDIALQEWRTYPLHQAESLYLEQAFEHLLKLRTQIEGAELAAATESGFRLFRSLDRFQRQRESNRQSRLPAVNDLVIRGLSLLEGQSHDPAILAAAQPPAVAEINDLVELYKSLENSLPEEVRDAFLHGIEKATDGLKGVSSSDPHQLRASLVALCQGAELLFTMREWQIMGEVERCGPVPLIGSFLRETVETGELPEDAAAQWDENLYPAFEQFWSTLRENLMVKAHARQSLRDGIDAEVEILQDLPDMSPDEIADCLTSLEGQFQALGQERLDLSPLAAQPLRWKSDLLLAVVAGGIPTFTLEQNIEQLSESGETVLADALATYLQTDDREPLLLALEGLLRAGTSSAIDGWMG